MVNRPHISAEQGALHSVVYGCVAIFFGAVIALAIWFSQGAPPDALPDLALAATVVFSVSVALRGVREVAFHAVRRQPHVVGGVAADVGIGGLVVLIVILVGTIADPSGMSQYGAVIMAVFLLPATAFVSAVTEFAIRSRAATRIFLAAGFVVGAIALVVYFWSAVP